MWIKNLLVTEAGRGVVLSVVEVGGPANTNDWKSNLILQTLVEQGQILFRHGLVVNVVMLENYS